MRSEALCRVMDTCGLYETPESKARREKALGVLRGVVRDWSAKVGSNDEADSNARVELYGSCRMGVQCPESDIDTVVIAQRSIRREEFFSSLKDMLGRSEEVCNLVALPSAFAPIMKMKICGVHVDISFASLPFASLPPNWDPLESEDYLYDIDYKSLLALGGVRNSDLLLQIVPSQETFRLFLRALRHWARMRGVYSNALGYFGGITWAILAAYICLLFPNAGISVLMQAFFDIMMKHPWPRPLLINAIEFRDLGFPVYNVNRPGPSAAPVITPAYPALNSTHNFGPQTLNILLREIQRGHAILRTIAIETDPSKVRTHWTSLLAPRDFFKDFRHFLMVTVSAKESDVQASWCGLLESKLRFLANWVDSSPNVSCCLWPRIYNIGNGKDEKISEAYFLGLVPARGVRALNVGSAVSNFLDMMNHSGLHKNPGEGVSIKHVRRKELPACVFEGRRTSQSQPKESKGRRGKAQQHAHDRQKKRPKSQAKEAKGAKMAPNQAEPGFAVTKRRSRQSNAPNQRKRVFIPVKRVGNTATVKKPDGRLAAGKRKEKESERSSSSGDPLHNSTDASHVPRGKTASQVEIKPLIPQVAKSQSRDRSENPEIRSAVNASSSRSDRDDSSISTVRGSPPAVSQHAGKGHSDGGAKSDIRDHDEFPPLVSSGENSAHAHGSIIPQTPPTGTSSHTGATVQFSKFGLDTTEKSIGSATSISGSQKQFSRTTFLTPGSTRKRDMYEEKEDFVGIRKGGLNFSAPRANDSRANAPSETAKKEGRPHAWRHRGKKRVKKGQTQKSG